jgi:YggT family protein
MSFVAYILLQLFNIYYWVLIVYILLSWFPGVRDSSFGYFLARITEPFLEPFRRIIPPIGMIDISPIVAILALRFASYGLQSLFRMLGWY